MEYWAHIDHETGKKQLLKDHCYEVSELCREFGGKIGLCNTAELIGLIHDCGKATKLFQTYMNDNDISLKGKINHSSCGGRYIFEHSPPKPTYEGIASQIISSVVASHHQGIINMFTPKGENALYEHLYPKKDILCDEALPAFFHNCSEEENITQLFEKSIIEFKEIYEKLKGLYQNYPKPKDISRGNAMFFSLGLITRYLLSCLLDADRYNTYLFSTGAEKEPARDDDFYNSLWGTMADRLEEHLKSLKTDTPINQKRKEISDSCKAFAETNHGGVFQLYVPTGGGKTLSSLRYALEAAKRSRKHRIFYVAPFKTILEQNAKEIKDILKNDSMILEYHSDVVDDSDDYKLLTERFSSPIILTTMVQFFNTLFSGKNRCVRRMHSLANSVIILDEVQSIPPKCINMFNLSVNFLAHICGCSVILCTATQPNFGDVEFPLLMSEPGQMIPNMDDVFYSFKRTELDNKTIDKPYYADDLAALITEQMEQYKNMLVVLNTKAAAAKAFKELQALEQDRQFKLYHLSTALCPANRIDIMNEIRGSLKNERVVCISTQLIEAGVNISFECVVRSLAGIDNIAQAAGRCNRHGDNEKLGKVIVLKCAMENLSSLIEIKMSQDASEKIFEAYGRASKSVDFTPDAIREYYKVYFENVKNEMSYSVKKTASKDLYCDTTLLDLLSANSSALKAIKDKRVNETINYPLMQAFETAGDIFEMIDGGGQDVLVPYKEGKKIINDICGSVDKKQINSLLRRAQRYTVHITNGMVNALGKNLWLCENAGVWILNEEYYSDVLGVTLERGLMETLIDPE